MGAPASLAAPAPDPGIVLSEATASKILAVLADGGAGDGQASTAFHK